MKRPARTTVTSLLTIAAILALPTVARAGCIPSVMSDDTGDTCVGSGALNSNTGTGNTAVGYVALNSNAGNVNTATGQYALFANVNGGGNTATGAYALSRLVSGYNNTAIGMNAGYNLQVGSNNIVIGSGAGEKQTTGSNNIAIGAAGAAADTAIIRIGTKGKQKSAFITGIRGVNVTGGQAVMVNADGQLGVVSSSRRYKQDIQPMGNASDALMQLQPVTFHYKTADENGQRPLQYGLIAEDVAAVMPDLAIYNEEGAPESVAYQLLPSLLLNEYQKQARELAAAKAELADNKAKFEALEAEMATLKLAVSRLAAAAPAVQLAASGN